MKKRITMFISAAAICAAAVAQTAQAPAFPGAEGFARYTTTGGRGGKVIHVTNLNDSGTGSLRAALSQSGNRIIVFDVAGDIHLKTKLELKNGNVTVLGQTSPGGITICDQTFESKANNVIIRFVRFRRGELVSADDGADAAWGRNKSNIILDHCSFSWSTDEVASWYDNKNFTMQWCVCAEGLASGHTKGTHSYGGIWGGKHASFHHTMIAHVNNRVPRINGARYEWSGYDKNTYSNTVEAERVDLRNNVYYNWGNGNGCYGGPGGGYCNIVNCYYKAGPATKNKTRVLQASVGESNNSTNTALRGMASRYYIKGNYVYMASSPEDYDWKGVIFDNGHITINGEKYTVDNNNYYSGEHVTHNEKSCVKVALDEPIDAGEVTTHSAETAFEKMLEYGGASLYRDGHDARYMEEARTGTHTYTGSLNGWKGIIDKCVDVIPDYTGEPYPWLSPAAGETRPTDFDTDGDGIPDEWEKANGLNPNDASDGSKYTLDSKGYYTNIEVYANSLVEHIVKAQNADAITAVEEYYPAYKAPTGIEEVDTPISAIRRVEYFSLDGSKLSEPVKGINIRKITYSNGNVATDKVMK